MHTDSPRTQSGIPAAVVIDMPAAAAPAPPRSRPPVGASPRPRRDRHLDRPRARCRRARHRALGPRLGLFQVETVLSGSMEPPFRPGDLLVVAPEPLRDMRPGQVLSFHAPTPATGRDPPCRPGDQPRRAPRHHHEGRRRTPPPTRSARSFTARPPGGWSASSHTPVRRSARSGSPGFTSSPSCLSRCCSPPPPFTRSGARRSRRRSRR